MSFPMCIDDTDVGMMNMGLRNDRQAFDEVVSKDRAVFAMYGAIDAGHIKFAIHIARTCPAACEEHDDHTNLVAAVAATRDLVLIEEVIALPNESWREYADVLDALVANGVVTKGDVFAAYVEFMSCMIHTQCHTFRAYPLLLPVGSAQENVRQALPTGKRPSTAIWK